MKYYLCFAIVIVCAAARTPRQSYFGHFQSTYPDGQANHGGQFLGDYRAQGGNLDAGNEFYGHQGPIPGQAFNHLAGVPFGDGVNNAGLKRQGPQSYQHFFNYDYQV